MLLLPAISSRPEPLFGSCFGLHLRIEAISKEKNQYSVRYHGRVGLFSLTELFPPVYCLQLMNNSLVFVREFIWLYVLFFPQKLLYLPFNMLNYDVTFLKMEDDPLAQKLITAYLKLLDVCLKYLNYYHTLMISCN